MEQTVIKTPYTKAEVNEIFGALYSKTTRKKISITKDEEENVAFFTELTCKGEDIEKAHKMLTVYGSEYHFTEVERWNPDSDTICYVYHTNLPYEIYLLSQHSNLVEFEFAE